MNMLKNIRSEVFVKFSDGIDLLKKLDAFYKQLHQKIEFSLDALQNFWVISEKVISRTVFKCSYTFTWNQLEKRCEDKEITKTKYNIKKMEIFR